MLTRLVWRRTAATLIASLLLLVVFAVLGFRVFSVLIGGGYADPSSESARAQQIVHEEIGGEANLVVLVRAPEGAEASGSAALGEQIAADLREHDGIESVHAFSDPGMQDPLSSDDGRTGMIVAHIEGTEARQTEVSTELVDQLTGHRPDGTEVLVGGSAPMIASNSQQVMKDLGLAEGIAVPITLILLLVVFGSLVSAVLPLAVGAFAVFGAFFSTWIIAQLTDVSIFSINLITALGLGLAIDYSLLIVSRFREELGRRGLDRSSPRRAEGVEDALRRTLQTAGRTVLFTGLAVASALCALLVFPTPFLRSFGFGGVAVVVVAMIGALLVLPALLALIGTRIDAIPIRRRGRPVKALSAPSRFWGRVGDLVYRRPIITGVPVLAALVLMASPMLSAEFASPDDRVLSEGHDARAAGDILREDFTGSSSAATVGIVSSGLELPELESYARDASRIDGVESVMAVTGTYADGQRVSDAPPGMDNQLESEDWYSLRVNGPSDGLSDPALEVVRQLRDLPPPEGREVLYTGTSARFIDDTDAVVDRLGLAGGLIAVTTFVLVFLFTGSVLLPIKALLMNVLTLSAVLGVVTLVFQHGWLSGILGFTPGPLDMSMPVLLFCIAFGLSMDYELFLIGRMKEMWDQTRSSRMAVVEGLAHTGRITTLAAAVLSVTFAAFGTSQVSFMQLFGLGTAFAILLDATLVRGVLVPAFMRIARRANWWAPAPLRWLHDRIGLAEAPEDPHTGPLAPRPAEHYDDDMVPPSARRRRGRHVAESAPRHRKGPW